MSETPPTSEPKQTKKVGLLKVFTSALSAFIGIQNDETRQRDFQQKSIIPYMIVGVVLATAFILALVFVAQQLDPSKL